MTGISTVSAGDDYVLILKTNGQVWGCGWNGLGNLGNGNNSGQTYPVQAQTGNSLVQTIIANGAHSMVLYK
jgi:alpha-tubulin suppressor-like RCC1 family protein